MRVRLGAHWLWIAPSILFIVVALSRRPNFDEWLVLRSGWLLIHGASSDLHFLMPFTWFAGNLTNVFQDVFLPVLLLRLLVVTTVLPVLWWSLQKHLGDQFSVGFAFFLCLVSGVFVSHALEFRYDTIILLCWLWCWGITSNKIGERESLLLGFACALLALHHTKGLFYAVSLLLYLIVSTRCNLTYLVRFCFGAMLAVVPWLLVLITNNLVEEQLNIYRQFSTLAMHSARVSPLDALAARVSADALWWFLVLLAAILGLLQRIAEKRPWRSSIFFVTVPVLFIFLHPRPWDYLIVPIIPFVSAFAAEGFIYFRSYFSERTHIFSALLFVPALLISVAGVYLQSFQATAAADVRVLREISQHLRRDDVVVDPTGAAYFISPLDSQWYLDSLFRGLLLDRRWMRTTVSDFQKASIVVASYRFNWVEEIAGEGLSKTHERVCGWLWMRRGDDRIAAIRQRCGPQDSGVLLSFWGK